jgi:hypothetical protein
MKSAMFESAATFSILVLMSAGSRGSIGGG